MKKRIQCFINKIVAVSVFLFLLPSFFTITHAQNEVTVNLDSTQQIIRGFGAANIHPWRPDMITDEIDKASGTGDGQLGFSILRLRLPSQTSEFSLNVPTAQLAYNMGVTIIASLWSPPATLKTNNNIVSGRLHNTAYATYAEHLKSFVDYMETSGVPIYAVDSGKH